MCDPNWNISFGSKIICRVSELWIDDGEMHDNVSTNNMMQILQIIQARFANPHHHRTRQYPRRLPCNNHIKTLIISDCIRNDVHQFTTASSIAGVWHMYCKGPFQCIAFLYLRLSLLKLFSASPLWYTPACALPRSVNWIIPLSRRAFCHADLLVNSMHNPVYWESFALINPLLW